MHITDEITRISSRVGICEMDTSHAFINLLMLSNGAAVQCPKFSHPDVHFVNWMEIFIERLTTLFTSINYWKFLRSIKQKNFSKCSRNSNFPFSIELSLATPQTALSTSTFSSLFLRKFMHIFSVLSGNHDICGWIIAVCIGKLCMLSIVHLNGARAEKGP